MFQHPLRFVVSIFRCLLLLGLSLLIGMSPTVAEGYTKGQIVFTSDRDGGYGVYVMNVDGSNLKQLVNNAVGYFSKVSWSPDGKSIAFATIRDGSPQIYLMDADGANQRRVTNDKYKDNLLWWTPDSKQIVYHSDHSNNPPSSGDYIVNIDGTNAQPDKDKVFGAPSPDGKHIASITQGGVSIANPDGTGKRLLPFTNSITDVQWSPDSKLLLVQFQQSEIDVVGIDGTNKRVLVNNYNNGVAWLPDSQHIVYAGNGDKGTGIFLMGIDGKNPALLQRGDATSPTLSPDGKLIAFVSGRDRKQEIYSMALDGSNVQKLTKGDGIKFFPHISPDGQHILFEQAGKQELVSLYLMDADGKNPTRLDNGYSALWSPDGKLIAFGAYRDPKVGVYVMNADGTNEHLVSNTGSEPLAWTPDSQQIAFIATYSPTRRNPGLFLVNFDGTKEHVLALSQKAER